MILSLVLVSCTSKIDYNLKTVSVKEFKEFINETGYITSAEEYGCCLLYTSDAADE